MLRSFIIASIVSASAFCAAAQAPFEGVIKFKGENKGIAERTELTWSIKGTQSRMDIVSHTEKAPNVNMSLVFLQGVVKFIAGDGQGGQLVYDVPYSTFANSEFSTAFAAEPTGKKANYAGYDCEEYIVRTANSEVSCWVSKTTGINPSSFPSVILGRGVFSVLQKNGVQGIPLKITFRDFAGNVITEQEVESIQASSVSPTIFDVPAASSKGN